MLSLEDAVVEAGVEDALADPSTLEAVDEVWEFTPRRAPTSVATSPSTLPLADGEAAEEGVVEA